MRVRTSDPFVPKRKDWVNTCLRALPLSDTTSNHTSCLGWGSLSTKTRRAGARKGQPVNSFSVANFRVAAARVQLHVRSQDFPQCANAIGRPKGQQKGGHGLLRHGAVPPSARTHVCGVAGCSGRGGRAHGLLETMCLRADRSNSQQLLQIDHLQRVGLAPPGRLKGLSLLSGPYFWCILVQDVPRELARFTTQVLSRILLCTFYRFLFFFLGGGAFLIYLQCVYVRVFSCNVLALRILSRNLVCMRFCVTCFACVLVPLCFTCALALPACMFSLSLSRSLSLSLSLFLSPYLLCTFCCAYCATCALALLTLHVLSCILLCICCVHLALHVRRAFCLRGTAGDLSRKTPSYAFRKYPQVRNCPTHLEETQMNQNTQRFRAHV